VTATLEYATPDDLTQELKDWMNALLCTYVQSSRQRRAWLKRPARRPPEKRLLV